MKRRKFITLLPFVFSGIPHAAARADAPWQAKLLRGARTSTGMDLGLQVLLAPGWKTYWRVPGDGGIPPDVSLAAAAQNIASLTMSLPLPSRFSDASGDTIGYKSEVVFLLRAEAINPSLPMTLDLTSFFGVCDEVCVPAKYDTKVELDASTEAMTIALWKAKVPAVATENKPVQSGIITEHMGKPHLVFSLANTVDDILIETKSARYFRKPDFTSLAGKALVAIDNVKAAADLKGQAIRITSVNSGIGLEQTLMVQ